MLKSYMALPLRIRVSSQIAINDDMNEYVTKSTDGMHIFLSRLQNDTYKNSFI